MLSHSVLPYIIPFSFDGEANSGDNAQLTCHVSKGDRPLQLSWSFHGRELSSHMGLTTTKIGDSISVLVIASVTAGHSGNYTCTARNPAGVANHTATLQVNGMAPADSSNSLQLISSVLSLLTSPLFLLYKFPLTPLSQSVFHTVWSYCIWGFFASDSGFNLLLLLQVFMFMHCNQFSVSPWWLKTCHS